MGKRILAGAALAALALAKERELKPSAIDEYIGQATAGSSAIHPASPGSTYSPNGLLANAARDLRASQVDDLVTIVVADRASAVTRGSTASARQSNANYGADAIFGPTKSGRLTDLLRLSGSRDLKGDAQTARENTLTTTLSARVTHVLSNGNMVVEGTKKVRVNGENQTVRVRGVLRPFDINTGNIVRSDRLALMEIQIEGRGVVDDAVKRPNLLYRILLGVMPF